jgi:hypothetical protein
MLSLARPERADQILGHFSHFFWLSLLMTVVFGGVLFTVSWRRDLYLRYTAAEARFWERLGFRSGRISIALRQFAESNVYKYILWFLVVAFLALTLLNAAMYFYFRYRFDEVAI